MFFLEKKGAKVTFFEMRDKGENFESCKKNGIVSNNADFFQIKVEKAE